VFIGAKKEEHVAIDKVFSLKPNGTNCEELQNIVGQTTWM